MDMNDVNWEEICKVAVGAGGAVGAAVLTPALLTWLGFTTGGILGGSIAAKIMSISAIFHGGSVPTGGLVALLQSWGTGLSWTGTVLNSGAAGYLANYITNICNQTSTAN